MSVHTDITARSMNRWGRSPIGKTFSVVAECALRRPGVGIGGVLLGAVAAILSVFPPSTRAVVIDEWAYVKAARHLGRSAVFAPDPTAVAPDLIPVGLSALAGRLVGSELAWLRAASAISFVAMGMLAYLIACELGATRRLAIACGIASVVNPIVLPLVTTGMSDLPGAAFCWGAILFGVRYFKRCRIPDAIACSVLSAAAAATRPPGIVAVAGVVALCLVGMVRRRRYAGGFLVGSLTLVAWAIAMAVYAEDSASTIHYLSRAFLAPPRIWAKMTVLYPTQVLLYIALIALPMSAGILIADRRRRSTVWGASLGGLAGFVGAVLSKPGVLRFPYMSWGSVVASNGIGGGDRPVLPALLLIAVSSVVGSSLGVLATSVLANRIRRPLDRDRVGIVRQISHRLSRPDSTTYVLVVVGCLIAVSATMGFAFEDGRTGYDRYLIPLFGPTLALVASRLTANKMSRAAFVVASVIVIGVVIVGVQDWYAHRNATWAALEALSASGVPPTEIDGGFEWSAYHQPLEYVPRFDSKSAVPWYIREFAPNTDREYVLSSSIGDRYEVIGTVRWKSWVREGTLYLQRRMS
jgi:hypothetical protein